MTTLYGWAAHQLTLADAITRSGLRHGLGLLSSPVRHAIGALHDGECVAPAAGGGVGQVDLQPVFEARLFDRDMELRWLHSDGGLGRAVLVAEDQQLLPAAFDEELPPVDAHATVQQSYLVWGRPGPGGPDGWTCLSAARIGSILVPLAPVGSGRRVRLQAREYVTAEPTHGNAYVADERLLGLESYVPDRAKGVSR